MLPPGKSLFPPPPPVHMKAKYAPNPAASGVPAAAARKEASGSGSAGRVSAAVGARGLAQRDAVTAGARPPLRPVLTQASPHSPARLLSPWSQGSTQISGGLGHRPICFSFWIVFISLSCDRVKARRWNSCFSCLLLNEADVFIFMGGGIDVHVLAGLGTSSKG